MQALYIFQVVNIGVAFLMVPLLLHYLGAKQYGLWLLFSAACAATVQLQSAIQGVSTKEIAIAYVNGSLSDFRGSLSRSRRAYTLFAVFVAGPVLLFGAIYFRLSVHVEMWGIASWVILISSYALTYQFAPNNAILLATDRANLNASISTATRLVFVVATIIFLAFDLTIMAPCLGLATSSILGVTLNTVFAKRRVKFFVSRPTGSTFNVSTPNISRYSIYTISAFMIYNGGFIIAAAIFPSKTASYGLALQISTLLSAMALIPLQVWLSRLIRSTKYDSIRELRVSLLTCNLLFLGGFLCAALTLPPLLQLVGTIASLPEIGVIVLIYAAFAVELNISIFVNHLTAKGDYSFTKRYAFVAFLALVIGVTVAWSSSNLWIGFLLVPLIIQSTLNLPFIVSKTFTKVALPRGSND